MQKSLALASEAFQLNIQKRSDGSITIILFLVVMTARAVTACCCAVRVFVSVRRRFGCFALVLHRARIALAAVAIVT